MSHLKLFNPDREDRQDDIPETLPFPGPDQQVLDPDHRAEGSNRTALLRAIHLFSNHECPHCRGVDVLPLELRDGLTGRGNLPIPGTGTLVGFHCSSCRSEWPVERASASS